MLKLNKEKLPLILAGCLVIILLAIALTVVLIRRNNQKLQSQDPNAAILHVSTKQSATVQQAQLAADANRLDDAKKILNEAIADTRNNDEKKAYYQALFSICFNANDANCTLEAAKGLDAGDLTTANKLSLAKMYQTAQKNKEALDMYKQVLSDIESKPIEAGLEEERAANIAEIKAKITQLEASQ